MNELGLQVVKNGKQMLGYSFGEKRYSGLQQIEKAKNNRIVQSDKDEFEYVSV